jgi:hypothetical protein
MDERYHRCTPEKEKELTALCLEKGIPPDTIRTLIDGEKEKDRKFELKMAAAGFTYDDIDRINSRPTKEKVHEEKIRFRFDYGPVLPLLQERIDTFAELHRHDADKHDEDEDDEDDEDASPSSVLSKPIFFPAVDIAAGSSVGTVALAATSLNPTATNNTNLCWYPTDNDVERTEEILRYQLEESPLFVDDDDQPVFGCNPIELRGLKTAKYNGKIGYVVCPDPKNTGRYGIKFSNDPNESNISFKKENIFHGGCPSLHEAILYDLQKKNKAKDFFQNLINRIRVVDIKDRNTWSNVEELYDKCAFVTCTNLLTAIGYRDPTAWQDTMQLASKLLHVDGYLLQYDAVDYADFGNTSTMEEYARTESLGFELDFRTSALLHENTGRMRNIIIWKKI